MNVHPVIEVISSMTTYATLKEQFASYDEKRHQYLERLRKFAESMQEALPRALQMGDAKVTIGRSERAPVIVGALDDLENMLPIGQVSKLPTTGNLARIAVDFAVPASEYAPTVGVFRCEIFLSFRNGRFKMQAIEKSIRDAMSPFECAADHHECVESACNFIAKLFMHKFDPAQFD